MTISYKKLWIMLAENEMSKAELRRRAGLSPATFTKLRRNQSVSMEVLLKIAEVMDCNIGDMMDFVKNSTGCRISDIYWTEKRVAYQKRKVE